MSEHLVRATIQPDVVLKVSDAELVDLSRQGLLHAYEHTDEAATVLGGAHVTTPGKWKAPAKSGDVVTAGAAMTDPSAGAGEKGE